MSVPVEEIEEVCARLRRENVAQRKLILQLMLTRLNADVRSAVLNEVQAECFRQHETYGEANRVALSGTGPDKRWLEHTDVNLDLRTATEIEKAFRRRYEAKYQPVNWVDLVLEEIAEAFQEDDPERLTAELTQAAALIVTWITVVRERGWV